MLDKKVIKEINEALGSKPATLKTEELTEYLKEYTLVKDEDIKEFLNHFIEYHNPEIPIFYFSIHGKTKEGVEAVEEVFKKEKVIVRKYVKGEKWDSYLIKNSDATIIFPLIENNLIFLGKGTRSEMNIALKHGRPVFIYTDKVGLRVVKAVHDLKAVKKDWDKVAFITQGDETLYAKVVINDVREILKENSRKIFTKESSDKPKMV